MDEISHTDQAGRLLSDHIYGPPTLEKLEQRLFDLRVKIETNDVDIAGLIEDVAVLKAQMSRLVDQFDNMQEETGMRADRIAIKAVAYMEKIDAMEARKAKRWERLGSAALWAFMTAVFVAWMLRK